MSNVEDRDKILKKIRKLLDLQRGAEEINSLAEAEHVARMVQNLMRKYQILESEIPDAERKLEDIDQYLVYHKEVEKRHEGKWVLYMYDVLARFNYCQAINSPHLKALRLVGKPTNCEIVDFLARQLITRIRSIAKDAWRDYKGLEKVKTFKRGFYLGAVKGIQHQLQLEKSKMDTQKDASKERALALNNDREIKEFIREKIGGLKSSNSRKLSGQDGKARGYETGKSISINKGVRGSSTGGRRALNS